MFAEIRKRLVLFNTVLMALLLICLMTVSYFGLIGVFFHEEQHETILYTKEEAAEVVPFLEKKPHREIQESFEPNDKIYCYVYDLDHQLRMVETPDKKRHQVLFPIIKNWKVPIGHAKPVVVKMSPKRRIFIIASSYVMDENKVLGTIYIAKDTTTYYDRLHVYLLVLCLIGVIFLIVIYWVGKVTANRAMIPIYKSFEQQRRFTADASHELRTPLAVLFCGTEAIMTDKESKISDFAHQTLHDMKDEIQMLSKIVAHLLTLARADEEGQQLSKEKFDIVQVARDVVHSLSSLALKKQIAFQLDLPEQVIVFADKERLYQLIYILVDNAIKYTQSNGKVFITICKKEEGIKISVQDTGIGIAPEDQQRIFDRFYRVDKSRSREQGGTGLGLSIAKWIVSAHNGSITVKSTLGKGTHFEVEI